MPATFDNRPDGGRCGLHAVVSRAAMIMAWGLLGSAAVAPLTASVAEAQSRAKSNAVRIARNQPEISRKAPPPVAAASRQQAVESPPVPLIAVVSIGGQHIEVHDPSGGVMRSRVSTGQTGYATPTGVFSILQRNRHHESNIYSNAPMPYMQRLTWSGIALHEGNVPNYPASHGCVRLPAGFAQSLWDKGRIGMRVIVSPETVAPMAFRHARLPEPALTEAASAADNIRLVAATDGTAGQGATPLTPYQAARQRLAKAMADKTMAEKAIKPAFELSTARSDEANRAAAALKASAGILADAEEHLEFENATMSTVQTEEAEAVILARIRIAEAGVKAAHEAHQKLKTHEAEASEQAFAAARSARDARDAAEAAADELRAARVGIEPVSVFVSRKTGKVHVRQGFAELAEEPITLADPARPLGTHVYTAMDTAADGNGLRWSVVSVPTSGGVSASGSASTRTGRGQSEASERASTAAEALDRFELPADVRRLLSERLWPGASIIVSDFGLGETGQGTDFVILTK